MILQPTPLVLKMSSGAKNEDFENSSQGVETMSDDKPQLHATFNPGVAALLSLFVPGLGQFYKGQIFGGMIWFVCVVLGYVALIVPGIVLHLLCVIMAAKR